MATLILGGVGRALGGPIGGLLGTFLGDAVDRAVLGGGKAREGARLASLVVQSSTYGEPLPRVYGRLRVAGNLIWTAGIAETASTSGGGKRGGARTTSYAYSSSFAVALSARSIADIARVWADGKLLRDASGGWLSPVTMRVHRGGDGQDPDPLIVAAEAAGGTPAYRGLAYAVFEDLPLADYGNRIPNLTFEVVADEALVDAAVVARDLTGGAGLIATGPFAAFGGFVAGRASAVREPLTQLAELFDLRFTDDGERLEMRAGPAKVATPIDDAELGSASTAGTGARIDNRAAAGSIDDTVAIGFLDAARDYQPGLQRASRRTGSSRVRQIDAPIVLEAASVKGLAHTMLARAGAARRSATLRLPWRRLGLRPGMQVQRDAAAGGWGIRRWSFADFVVELEVEAQPLRSAASVAADPGRVHDAGAAAPGPTTLHLLDLPPLFEGGGSTPRLWIAGAGTSPGWRRSGVALSADDGDSYAAVGEVAAPSSMGVTTSGLAAGSADRWDRANSVEVILIEAAMWLESRSEAAVLAGANLALVGNEIIQFATVEALGGRRFRLSGLLRGRRGGSSVNHATGARFVGLDPARLLAVDPPAELLGRGLRVRATGHGDAAALPVALTLAGNALRPLSPVFLASKRDGADIVFSWRRRSRAGFAWLDGADVPLGETLEAYRLTVAAGAMVLQTASVDSPEWRYAAGAQAADGVGPGTILTLAVAQASDLAGPGAVATADFIVV